MKENYIQTRYSSIQCYGKLIEAAECYAGNSLCMSLFSLGDVFNSYDLMNRETVPFQNEQSSDITDVKASYFPFAPRIIQHFHTQHPEGMPEYN